MDVEKDGWFGRRGSRFGWVCLSVWVGERFRWGCSFFVVVIVLGFTVWGFAGVVVVLVGFVGSVVVFIWLVLLVAFLVVVVVRWVFVEGREGRGHGG